MTVVYYLTLIAAWSNSTIVIPEAFPSLAECRAAGDEWRQQSQFMNTGTFICLPKGRVYTPARRIAPPRCPTCKTLD